MNARPEKILALQFNYLGDAALMTPALRAIREHLPNCELHVLVAEETAPLLQHLPWLTHVWIFPRIRGKANLRRSWPVIRALRRERFDRSVDFSGNDRSAIVSWLCGARQRLTASWPGGFLGRRFCYTQTVPTPATLHQALRYLRLLSVWGISAPSSLEIEIRADPSHADLAARLLPPSVILCHLATSQPKKEWPVAHWARLYSLATAAGLKLVFSTGTTTREQALAENLKKFAPRAPVLSPIPDLATFLAVLKRARLFISGDTGPLHFAAGLNVPTIGLFGPTLAKGLAPFGSQHQVLQSVSCACDHSTSVCRSAQPCMATILPEVVLELIQKAPVTSSLQSHLA